MSVKQTRGLLILIFIYAGQICYGQTNSCDKADKELTNIYSRIFPFYYANRDSLNYYSDLFATKLTNFIKTNPATLDCKFKSLTDSNACSVVTSNDGLFRIYSWDTWQGGTAHKYKDLYQFRSGNKVYAKIFDNEEGDMGTCFTGVYSLTTSDKTYFLATSAGSESSRYWYEIISVYTISNNTLNDSVQLIKTSSGLNHYMMIEYDAFSIPAGPERPTHLIKYDPDKKIIYIPVVLENGKVTDQFILYRFTGKYFEKTLTERENDKQK